MKGAFSHWNEQDRFYVLFPQKVFRKYKININHKKNLICNIPNKGHSKQYARIVCDHIANAVLLGNGNKKQVRKYIFKELENLKEAIEKNGLAGVIDAKFATYGDIQ